MNRNEVLVVIPAYNEADIIENTINSLKKVFSPLQILVIDDGSSDNTSECVQKTGVHLETLEENIGKGGAMNKAVELIPSSIYLFVDADLGETAHLCSKILEPVVKEFGEMSIAYMPAPKKHKGGFGIVKWLASYAVEKYTDIKVNAVLSGQRAIRRDLILDIGGFANGYGIETDLTISALCKGYEIIEVPIDGLTHKLTERNIAGFKHRFKQFMDILKTIKNNKSKWEGFRYD